MSLNNAHTICIRRTLKHTDKSPISNVHNISKQMNWLSASLLYIVFATKLIYHAYIQRTENDWSFISEDHTTFLPQANILVLPLPHCHGRSCAAHQESSSFRRSPLFSHRELLMCLLINYIMRSCGYTVCKMFTAKNNKQLQFDPSLVQTILWWACEERTKVKGQVKANRVIAQSFYHVEVQVQRDVHAFTLIIRCSQLCYWIMVAWSAKTTLYSNLYHYGKEMEFILRANWKLYKSVVISVILYDT